MFKSNEEKAAFEAFIKFVKYESSKLTLKQFKEDIQNLFKNKSTDSRYLFEQIDILQ